MLEEEVLQLEELLVLLGQLMENQTRMSCSS